MKPVYQCKHCKRKTTLITLGDMYYGCAYCGSRDGFSESNDDGKTWRDVQKTESTDKLDRFLRTGRIEK